jgi:hypothetical protein
MKTAKLWEMATFVLLAGALFCWEKQALANAAEQAESEAWERAISDVKVTDGAPTVSE